MVYFFDIAFSQKYGILTEMMNAQSNKSEILTGGKQVQKLVYLSNSRDYTEHGSINENKYFTHVNERLEKGWKVAHITPNAAEIYDHQNLARKETFAAFVLLEMDDEGK